MAVTLPSRLVKWQQTLGMDDSLSIEALRVHLAARRRGLVLARRLKLPQEASEFDQLLNKDSVADDIHLFNDQLREWEDYYGCKSHCQSVTEILGPYATR